MARISRRTSATATDPTLGFGPKEVVPEVDKTKYPHELDEPMFAAELRGPTQLSEQDELAPAHEPVEPSALPGSLEPPEPRLALEPRRGSTHALRGVASSPRPSSVRGGYSTGFGGDLAEGLVGGAASGWSGGSADGPACTTEELLALSESGNLGGVSRMCRACVAACADDVVCLATTRLGEDGRLRFPGGHSVRDLSAASYSAGGYSTGHGGALATPIVRLQNTRKCAHPKFELRYWGVRTIVWGSDKAVFRKSGEARSYFLGRHSSRNPEGVTQQS